MRTQLQVMICDAVTGAHNSIAFNNSTSLALSQHTGLCCVILPIRAGLSAVSESVCVCESVCVGACMRALCSPVHLLQAALTQMVLGNTTYQRHCLGKASFRR